MGIYYYGARWYDRIAGAKRHPVLGRFMQPDTIVPNPGDAQSFVHAVGAKRHRYAYVLNNPLKYVDPTGHCGVSAIAGPPGLLLDIPCWGSGVGEAVVAATGAAVVGAAAAPLVVSYVLNEEPLNIPPLYPELAPEVAQGGLLVTIPVPDSTTVTSGIPVIPDETLPLISSSSGDVPSQQVLADPLIDLDLGNNIVYSSNYRETFFDAYPALEGKVVVHHAIEQQVLTRYPGLFTESEIHSLDNLRGIPREINSDLHLSRIPVYVNKSGTKNEINETLNQTPISRRKI